MRHPHNGEDLTRELWPSYVSRERGRTALRGDVRESLHVFSELPMIRAAIGGQRQWFVGAWCVKVGAVMPAPRWAIGGAVPRIGWIRAVREACGMSASDMAARLCVSRHAVHAQEASEISGNLKLETLQRAAAVLDCQLVYALVPNGGIFEGIVQFEGGRLVDSELAAVAQNMALEGQAADMLPGSRQDHIDDLLRAGRLWKTHR